MQKTFLLSTLLLTFVYSAFTQNVMEKNGIKLTPVSDSPLFPDAELKLNSPMEGEQQLIAEDSAKVSFKYALKNYKLTEQTSDAMSKHCSNSKQGQHIHVIIDNEPYLAKYDTNFAVTLKKGNHVILSFLSRSYHESLKHKKAYDLRQVYVGPAKEKHEMADLTKPLIFYSRPKGEYAGEDAKKILLDFYLINCKLSPKGYKVKVIINSTTEFIVTKWQAYALEGLPMGANTVRLELLDKKNNLVKSDFSSATRLILLK